MTRRVRCECLLATLLKNDSQFVAPENVRIGHFSDMPKSSGSPELWVLADSHDLVSSPPLGRLLGWAAARGWRMVRRTREELRQLRAGGPIREGVVLVVPEREGDVTQIRQLRSLTEAPMVAVSTAPSEGSPTVEEALRLEAGADLYLSANLDGRLAEARVDRFLAGVERHIPHVGPQVLADGVSIWVNELRVPFTELERRLVVYLSTRRGQAPSREEIHHAVRQDSYDPLDRSLDVHVSRIRRKLRSAGLDGPVIRAVRGIGYTWVGPEVSEAPWDVGSAMARALVNDTAVAVAAH